MKRTQWIVLLATAISDLTAEAAAQTPTPKVTGPIAVAANSFPFLAADRNLQPVDLKKKDYVEEEFIVSGTANVYDWTADGAVTAKTANVPYGTRIAAAKSCESQQCCCRVIECGAPCGLGLMSTRRS
jgi:hypothetical protein